VPYYINKEERRRSNASIFGLFSRDVAWWQRIWDLHSRSRVRVRVYTSCKSLEQPGFYSLTWAHKVCFSGGGVSSNKKKKGVFSALIMADANCYVQFWKSLPFIRQENPIQTTTNRIFGFVEGRWSHSTLDWLLYLFICIWKKIFGCAGTCNTRPGVGQLRRRSMVFFPPRF